jgi:hypothetical protein
LHWFRTVGSRVDGGVHLIFANILVGAKPLPNTDAPDDPRGDSNNFALV